MKLDFQEINHNHITRLVIFATFLFKESRKEEKVYAEAIRGFIRRRIPYDIELSIEVGPKESKVEQRDSVIDSILNGDDVTILNLVVVKFKTGFKDVNMQIDLNKEEKYEYHLYL